MVDDRVIFRLGTNIGAFRGDESPTLPDGRQFPAELVIKT